MIASLSVLATAALLHLWSLHRFIRVLSASSHATPELVEGLNQLLVSGSGGVRPQLDALAYVVGRRYTALPDFVVVRAGDRALASFWIAFSAMVLVWIAMATS
jgi:hypothetical protein